MFPPMFEVEVQGGEARAWRAEMTKGGRGSGGSVEGHDRCAEMLKMVREGLGHTVMVGGGGGCAMGLDMAS